MLKQKIKQKRFRCAVREMVMSLWRVPPASQHVPLLLTQHIHACCLCLCCIHRTYIHAACASGVPLATCLHHALPALAAHHLPASG